MPANFVRIEIDNRALHDFSANAILQQVTIEQELNQHWFCVLEIRQTQDVRFPFENAIGKALTVFATDQDGGEHSIFKGFVLESELLYELSGSFTARLVGVTKSYRLDLTPRQRYYLGKTFKDLVGILTSEAGINSAGEPDATRTRNYVQVGQTDFEFLKRLADDSQSWIRPTDDGIEIRNAFQQGSKVLWRGEDGLISFRVQGKLSQPAFNGAQYDRVAMKSQSFTKVQDDPVFFSSMANLVSAVKAESKNLPPGYVHQRSRVRTVDEYEQLLKKECRRSLGSTVTAVGVSKNHELKPGDEITIEGPLDAKGTYGLTRVLHKWEPSGYTNEFVCTLWKQFTEPEAPEVRSWPGLIPARVVENDDPNRMGQIKVQFFWQEDGPTGFIPLMTPYAGADRGIMFVPEIGDEVWVFFEDGDPERPRILGSAWNGVDKPPAEEFWGADISPNDVKRIVTKSGHRFSMADKQGKEAIGIATPVHTKIVLHENTDETGRPAIMICAEDGDIMLSAPNGRIHFRAKFWSREVGD